MKGRLKPTTYKLQLYMSFSFLVQASRKAKPPAQKASKTNTYMNTILEMPQINKYSATNDHIMNQSPGVTKSRLGHELVREQGKCSVTSCGEITHPNLASIFVFSTTESRILYQFCEKFIICFVGIYPDNKKTSELLTGLTGRYFLLVHHLQVVHRP